MKPEFSYYPSNFNLKKIFWYIFGDPFGGLVAPWWQTWINIWFWLWCLLWIGIGMGLR